LNELILPSLEIENFRAFRHLRVPHLARVNLIVGKNNVGKTSLLEALWLYARRGAPAVIWEQLAVREESAARNHFLDTQPSVPAIRNLFSKRPNVLGEGAKLYIGPMDTPAEQLSIAIERHPDTSQQQRGMIPFLVLRWGSETRLFTELMHGTPDISYLPSQADIPHTIVTAGGLTQTYITALWDRIALTDLENYVTDALRIIAPEIERVNMISDSALGPQRIAMMRVHGIDQPVSLRSYGDGMYRLFVIAVAAVNARQGLLLIDEIENGLHYSAQPDLWRLVFELARSLQIQLFATTHSKDCVEAFQRVANAHVEEGQVVRLGRKNSGVVATLFDEDELEVAIEQNVEVR
jgi:ABC-type cobalamin/Fe3+-siderophores transport system ATPase subunit